MTRKKWHTLDRFMGERSLSKKLGPFARVLPHSCLKEPRLLDLPMIESLSLALSPQSSLESSGRSFGRRPKVLCMWAGSPASSLHEDARAQPHRFRYPGFQSMWNHPALGIMTEPNQGAASMSHDKNGSPSSCTQSRFSPHESVGNAQRSGSTQDATESTIQQNMLVPA